MFTFENPDTRLPNGPDLWDQILAQMPTGAVIAGGAVRDCLLCVDPKDIDVFMGVAREPDIYVGTSSPVLELELEAADPRCGLYQIDNVYERQSEYEALNNIALVSSGTMLGYRVDAIEIIDFDPAKLIEDFDFGLTRCFYDGEIHVTEECVNDIENLTVTLLLTDRVERSRKRFERFNERMGGVWTLVEPTL